MFKYHTQKMEMYYDKVVEMHQKGCSPSTISKKFNLDSDTIRRWIRNFAAENNPSEHAMKTTEVTDNKPSGCPDDIKELKEKIRQLEKELKHERLRADVYDELINVAEENFKIQIRKKAGAKH